MSCNLQILTSVQSLGPDTGQQTLDMIEFWSCLSVSTVRVACDTEI